MRPTQMVLLASLLSSAAPLGGCGATRTQRGRNAALAVAGGAGLLVAGALLTREDESDCSHSSGNFCPDLSEDYDVLGALVMLTGAGIGTAGLVRLATAPAAEPGAPATTRPCSRTPARGACATPPPSDRRRTP